MELGVPTVKANLGTTLKHFDGDVSGLRLALEIGVPITVHVNRGADIEIMITATFEQEVRVSIDVDGSAVENMGIYSVHCRLPRNGIFGII